MSLHSAEFRPTTTSHDSPKVIAPSAEDTQQLFYEVRQTLRQLKKRSLESAPIPHPEWMVSPSLTREFPNAAKWVYQTLLKKSEYHSGEEERDKFLTALTTMLRADTRHYISEFNLRQSETTYTLELDLTQECLSGEGYSTDLGLLASTYVYELIRQRAKLERVVTEHKVLERQRRRMRHDILRALHSGASVLPNWLMVSPPDQKHYGYHGATSSGKLQRLRQHLREHHHTFTFHAHPKEILYEKSAETDTAIPVRATIEVTQFRTWHNLHQLRQFFDQINAPIPLQPNLHWPAQFYAHSVELIPNTQHTAAETQNWLRQNLFYSQENWVDGSKFMPYFEDESTEKEIWELMEIFFLPTAVRTLAALTPKSLNDTNSLRKTLHSLELFLSEYSAATQKYIEEKNTNPLYNQLVARKRPLSVKVKQLLRGKQFRKNPQQIEPLTSTSRLANLQRASQLNHRRLVEQQSLSQRDLQWLAKNGPALFSFAGFALGSAQCYVLAPFTLPLSVMRSTQGLGGLSSFEAALPSLSTEEKQHHLEYLNEFVELDLRAQGAKKVYMVHRSMLEGRGCRVDPHTSEVTGPCLGPQGYISLDDPINYNSDEALVFQMNQAEFDLYRKSLVDRLQKEEVLAVNKALSQKLTGTELEKAKETVERVTQSIFQSLIKTSISFSEFFTGLPPLNKTARRLLPGQLIHLIESSSHPLLLLENLARELAQQSFTNPGSVPQNPPSLSFDAKVPFAKAV